MTMRRSIASLVLACLLAGLSSCPASASFDPVGAGTAKLVLNAEFARFLKAGGVRIEPRAGASKRGKAYLLPVQSGLIDPTIGQGTVDVGGELRFTSSRKSVPLRRMVIKTKAAPLIARVGGSQLKVVNAKGLQFERSGFDSLFSARQLKLTAKVATRFNKKLRPSVPFTAGQAIGTLRVRAAPTTMSVLPREAVTLQLSDSFAQKLEGLFVAANPIFPAEHQGTSFTFPLIPGGALAPDGQTGNLVTGGSIEFLQLPSRGQILWHELWVQLDSRLLGPEVEVGPSPPNRGKLGRVGVAALTGTGSVLAQADERRVALSGETLTLQGEAAAAFNEAFGGGSSPFVSGELLGTLSFSALLH